MKTSLRPFFLALTAGVVLLGYAACSQSSNFTPLKVKVVSLEACGATEPTIALVKETAKELNLQIDFQYKAVSTIEEARAHRHLGSPTILVNGLDIEPAARGFDNYGIS